MSLETLCFSLPLFALDSTVVPVGRLPVCGGKGGYQQLQTYVALTASLLRKRSVLADIFCLSSGSDPLSLSGLA